MADGGLIFLLLLILLILPITGWIFYTRYRAKKQGLPAPPLSSYNPFKRNTNPFADSSSSRKSRNGPLGWVKDKLPGFAGSGRSQGPYHGAAHSRLDPDGAWDDRVGDEADRYGAGYEEQELGLHPPSASAGNYAGSGYGQALPQYGEERGRARNRGDDEEFIGGSQRGLNERYDEEVNGVNGGNPFDDGLERNDLRGVSPRPMDDNRPGHKKMGSKDSQQQERRSVFHETL